MISTFDGVPWMAILFNMFNVFVSNTSQMRTLNGISCSQKLPAIATSAVYICRQDNIDLPTFII